MVQKGIVMTFVYCLIFLFSLLAIFQIRSFLIGEELFDLQGQINFLFFSTKAVEYEDFVLFKLTIFLYALHSALS